MTNFNTIIVSLKCRAIIRAEAATTRFWEPADRFRTHGLSATAYRLDKNNPERRLSSLRERSYRCLDAPSVTNSVMKTAVVLACLLVAVAAKPQFGRFGLGGFGSATGGANSGSFQGQSSGPFGNSQVQNSFASAGGSAFGGGASLNRATSNVGQSTGLFGNQQFANNQATSNQFGR
ncbi:uncharacterized protein LOC122364659 isoform X2 [Amphibalanus amphitrite]|uniref:uncharacterized protein LOC122364659 isoform X2 n=1 Tax=Amphibalanus amphitrite TaxID=1232801 RepID=UPI001C90C379|nr:uncharacterized protein LOC122364659 isoform X2 [Amphibalanus amphitrite]